MNNNKLPIAPATKTGWPWNQQINYLPDKMSDGREWPKISIVTPSYNQGQFIEETIRSVLLQGYPNLDYVVIDGGSTDNTVEILKKYEPWLTHWVSEPDNGQVDAINKGLRYCTGEWVNWLNSDDILEENALKKLAQIIINIDDNVKVIAGSTTYIDSRGTEINSKIQPRIPNSINSFFTLDNNKCPVLNQPSTFIKKGYMKLHNLNYVMDWVLYLELTDLYPDSFFSKDIIFSRFRIHETNKSTLDSEKFHIEAVSFVDNYKKKYGFSKTRFLIEKWKRYSFRRISFIKAKNVNGKKKRIINILSSLVRYPDLLFDTLFLETIYNKVKKIYYKEAFLKKELTKVLGNDDDLFFIQIGTNDGITGDLLYELLKKNKTWKGIFVEPLPYIFQKIIELHKGTDNYIYENIAICDSDDIEYKDIFYISKRIEDIKEDVEIPYWYDQIASFSKEHVIKQLSTILDENIVKNYLVAKKVRCKTLKTAIKSHDIKKIDLLIVDVEGYDYNIIKQIEDLYIKPRVIVYEHKHLNISEYNLSKLLLFRMGYKYIEHEQDVLAYRN